MLSDAWSRTRWNSGLLLRMWSLSHVVTATVQLLQLLRPTPIYSKASQVPVSVLGCMKIPTVWWFRQRAEYQLPEQCCHWNRRGNRTKELECHWGTRLAVEISNNIYVLLQILARQRVLKPTPSPCHTPSSQALASHSFCLELWSSNIAE